MGTKIQPNGQSAARRVLVTSIGEGLRGVLGESGFQMISRRCPPDLFASDPRKLHQLLVGIFATEGAVVIERVITRALLDKLGSNDRAEAGAIRGSSGPELESRKRTRGEGDDFETSLIRRFAAVAELPSGQERASLQQVITGGRRARESIESTAASFVDAVAK